VGQSGAGAGFLRVLRFPLQSSFAPPITSQSPSCIIWEMYNRPMCGRSTGTYRDLRDLKQRDLRNLNLGDLKKGPNGGVSPTPQKKARGNRAGLDAVEERKLLPVPGIGLRPSST
jgi:hypothetical protein